MTDRLQGFIVTLEEDIRDDDAQPTINAILQLRHVASVQPVVADFNDLMARERVRHEMCAEVIEVFRKARKK